jgi:hypothetical protein
MVKGVVVIRELEVPKLLEVSQGNHFPIGFSGYLLVIIMNKKKDSLVMV